MKKIYNLIKRLDKQAIVVAIMLFGIFVLYDQMCTCLGSLLGGSSGPGCEREWCRILPLWPWGAANIMWYYLVLIPASILTLIIGLTSEKATLLLSYLLIIPVFYIIAVFLMKILSFLINKARAKG